MSEQQVKEKHFRPDMTIAAALAVHPRVPEVFAAFRLGGCAHCRINEVESIEQVCASYGINADALLDELESLMAS